MTTAPWEANAGDTLADVTALCRHAARDNGQFSSTTAPALADVSRWITEAGFWVDGMLMRNGLDPDQPNAGVMGILNQLVSYDVCVKIEMSLPGDSNYGAPNERMLVFQQRRDVLIEMMVDGTLAAMGAATTASNRAPVIGGISYARKAVAESDYDAVPPRAAREQFDYPGSDMRRRRRSWNNWGTP